MLTKRSAKASPMPLISLLYVSSIFAKSSAKLEELSFLFSDRPLIAAFAIAVNNIVLSDEMCLLSNG